jgi:DNA end-binding protein Ku
MARKTKKSSEKPVGGRGERPVWKGYLKFGLVSIPVKAFTAKAKDGGDIELHWLHAPCHNRIHFQKVCPIHGEVSDDEIVSGYKYGRKNYVVIEPEELAKLHRQSADTLEISTAVPPQAIDPMYYTDKSYFLLPDGDANAQAYGVFQEALAEEERIGLAVVVLFRREQLVALRPEQNLLIMTSLSYADHFKDAGAFARQVSEAKSAPQELELAKTLISQLAPKDFQFSQFKDPRGEKLHELIAAKIKGKEVEAAPEEEEAPVALDFMAALKKSLAQAGKKPAPAHRTARAAHRRKVS